MSSASDATAVADDLERQLAARGTPERAEHERRYLRSDLRHLGVPVPEIRAAVTACYRTHGTMDHDELVTLAAALWSIPVHERRVAAVELLRAGVDRLSVADAARIGSLLRAARTWALVDPLAIHVAGVLAARDPAAWDDVAHRWAGDDDHWVRRASLLVHLPGLRGDAGGFTRFVAVAEPMLAEREFFIRKAIGWVLREAGKQDPDRVTDWLTPRAGDTSALTVREAVRHLPAAQRERVLAARAAATA